MNRVVDHNGCVVLKMLDEQTIASEAEVIFNQIGVMEANAKFWHPDHPYLYKVNTLVMEDDKTIDVVDHPLGIRTFELDAEQGFKLNGKPIKLIGYNRHQCFPYVGDAAPNSLHYKDMLQLKQMGFNAMRTSHYPQDDEIMRACDELGILVYEEPPSWVSVSQNPQWFANYEQASRVMVRNHRNHPSVVLWGAGINHRGAVPQIHAAIKQEDPTRLTASQNSRWTGWQTSWITDVYANMPYGPVSWERNEPMLAMEGDNGPEALAQIKRDPKMTGILSWVSHAYYTFHPSKAPEDRTWAGMWDIFRYVKRPDLMWYPTELKEAPMVYIPDAWKAGIKTLTVYSNAPEIELFVNDKSLGRYQPSKDLRFQGLNHPPYEIDIHHFEAGKLTAKGLYYGKVLAEQTVYTPGKPVALRFGFDKDGRIYEADGSDILIGHAEVVDANGTIIKNSDVEIEFSVKGKATLVGETEDIGSNPVKAKDGVASVLIRAGNTAGKVTVTARSKGLKSSGATIEMVASEENMMLANAYPIYDYERVRVDMGAQNQLLQFGWLPWNGTDNQPSAIDIDALGGFKAEVKTFSENGVLRWLGEMNVMGRNGYVYGDGALGIDEQGLVLEFKDLPAGKYKLKTYHHAPRSNTNSMDPNREKLKSVKIQHLPYAEVLKVMVEDKKGTKHHQNIEVTQGDEVQFRKPMTADATKLFGREKVECRPRPGALEMEFESDGNPIRFVFKDALGDRGVWLNGFELSENY